MKRFASVLFALALALSATFACAAEFDGALTLMGSSTLGPVISQVAKMSLAVAAKAKTCAPGACCAATARYLNVELIVRTS